MDDEEITRRRHALQSQIDVLAAALESHIDLLAAAQRRLAEIDDDDHQTHEPVPVAHLAGAGAGRGTAASGDQQQDDDLYQLALQSKMDVLAAAQKRLAELDEQDYHYQTHERPAAAHDDGHLAVAGAADSSLLLNPVSLASGDQKQQDHDDHLYPFLGAPFNSMQLNYQENNDGNDGTWSSSLLHRATESSNVPAGPQVATTSAAVDAAEQAYHDVAGHGAGVLGMELDLDVAFQDVLPYYLPDFEDTFDQRPTADDLQAAETEEAGGAHEDWPLSDHPFYYDSDDMWMQAPRVEATPTRFTDEDGGGFGGVPASAAAIAGLKKQRHDGSSGADDTCVICMREYKKRKMLYVMPCAFKHRFHRKCLKKWLARSHLCPLCRHALPTDDTPVLCTGPLQHNARIV